MQAAITFLGENAMFGRVGEMAKPALKQTAPQLEE